MEIPVAVLLLAIALFLGGDMIVKVLSGVAAVLAVIVLIQQAR